MNFTPGSMNYDLLAPRYAAARAFSPKTIESWLSAVKPFIPVTAGARLLDLGCGTGRFATLFANQFDIQVIALDASYGMVNSASGSLHRPNLLYGVARAEQIPLPDSSCNVVWLSQVIHHVADRTACAREVRRIVRADGVVMIRGALNDRLDSCPTYFRFFPGARRIVEQLPTLGEITTVFRAVGFLIHAFQSVQQQTCLGLRELADRTRLRADSTLVLLPDDEFQACQAELDKAAEAEEVPEPVIETIDLLVFRPREASPA